METLTLHPRRSPQGKNPVHNPIKIIYTSYALIFYFLVRVWLGRIHEIFIRDIPFRPKETTADPKSVINADTFFSNIDFEGIGIYIAAVILFSVVVVALFYFANAVPTIALELLFTEIISVATLKKAIGIESSMKFSVIAKH